MTRSNGEPECLKAFGQHQRIIVVEATSPLVGRIGTVVRLRINDNGAWVQMDKTLPKALRSFPLNDTRARHVILYPEQCAVEGSIKPKDLPPAPSVKAEPAEEWYTPEEVCYEKVTEGCFKVDLSNDKDRAEWKEDWELFKRLNEALRVTGEAKYGKPLNIVDFAGNSGKVQCEVLSELAGRRVYGWEFLPGMREMHHAKKCPVYLKGPNKGKCPQGVGVKA